MLKAVITTLLLGTSTIAAADSPYDQTLYNDNPNVRRHRVLLADNVMLGGRSQQATWVPIDARHRIDRVRIKLQAGRTFIDSVTIVYANGYRETMQLRHALTARDPSITIDVRYGVRGLLIDATQRGYARGGGWRRFSTASVDVIGIRR